MSATAFVGHRAPSRGGRSRLIARPGPGLVTLSVWTPTGRLFRRQREAADFDGLGSPSRAVHSPSSSARRPIEDARSSRMFVACDLLDLSGVARGEFGEIRHHEACVAWFAMVSPPCPAIPTVSPSMSVSSGRQHGPSRPGQASPDVPTIAVRTAPAFCSDAPPACGAGVAVISSTVFPPAVERGVQFDHSSSPSSAYPPNLGLLVFQQCAQAEQFRRRS